MSYNFDSENKNILNADPETQTVKKLRVGVGEFVVSDSPAVISTTLGSCVGIMLHDPVTNTGGLAHVMLPCSNDRVGKPGKFADTAVAVLMKRMHLRGASPKRIVAKIVGGARMFAFQSTHAYADIGNKNVEAVLDHLRKEGIPVIDSEVGGAQGRSVDFNLETGKVFIRVNNVVVKVL